MIGNIFGPGGRRRADRLVYKSTMAHRNTPVDKMYCQLCSTMMRWFVGRLAVALTILIPDPCL